MYDKTFGSVNSTGVVLRGVEKWVLEEWSEPLTPSLLSIPITWYIIVKGCIIKNR
jgi:hypothetical protein